MHRTASLQKMRTYGSPVYQVIEELGGTCQLT